MCTATDIHTRWCRAALVAALAGCSGGSTAPQRVWTLTPVASSNAQTGLIGTGLSQPLQVKVLSDGVPDAYDTVAWGAFQGRVSPPFSITDAAGIATAEWTLGFVAGEARAIATLAGPRGTPVTFTATTLPGPAAVISKVRGDHQSVAANRPTFDPLLVTVTDLYRNPITGQAVIWTIASGPVAFLGSDSTTTPEGFSGALLAPTGHPGAAVVRAAIQAGGPSVDFALKADTASGAVVVLKTDIMAFVSKQNGSKPAVDTIPAGETVTWVLSGSFDYYDGYSVTSVGTPSFQGGDFNFYQPVTVTVKFTAAGTYRYVDSYHPAATGTVVVR